MLHNTVPFFVETILSVSITASGRKATAIIMAHSHRNLATNQTKPIAVKKNQTKPIQAFNPGCSWIQK
jgi:hypothetical protein